MTLHEISHSLLEGCNSLVAKGAITEANRADIEMYAKCLNRQSPQELDSKIEENFKKSYVLYNAGQTALVGYSYGQIAVA